MNTKKCYISREKNIILTTSDTLSYWLLKEYPDAEQVSFEDGIKIIEDGHRRPAQEIDSEKFQDMLECLPPENWHNLGHLEYFQMCEYWSGSITDYYARVGQRYFTFRDTAYLKGDKITKILEGVL